MRYLVYFALLAPLLGQHQSEKDKAKNPAMGDPAAIQAGKKLYEGSCAVCHGPQGQGGRGPNLRERGVWHPLDDDALFKTLKLGVASGGMPPTALPDDQIWQLAAFVRSLSSPAFETGAPGDPEAGQKLFWGKAGCNECHTINGRGGRLGPDLSDIGAQRPLEALREALLDPAADGAQGYKPVTAVRKDGRALKGVARDRTNYSLVLQDAQGGLHLLRVADLREISIQRGSPMPADYSKRLSAQEIDDLLAYLSRRSVRPKSEEKK